MKIFRDLIYIIIPRFSVNLAVKLIADNTLLITGALKLSGQIISKFSFCFEFIADFSAFIAKANQNQGFIARLTISQSHPKIVS